MKKILISLCVLAGISGFVFYEGSAPVGFDKSNPGGSLGSSASEYNQTASRSQQGLVKNIPGRVFAIEITSDSQSLRYLQFFDRALAQVPARTASLSSFQSLKIYKASLSWASDSALAAKPIGSYLQYASTSMVMSIPIPAATSSASPTVVRLNSSDLAPAHQFNRGIIWGISNTFGSYSSSSINTARFTVKVIYE